jgi:predicted nucleotidyltransferase
MVTPTKICNGATIDAVTTVLKRHPDIRLAYVFGSVAAGSARPASDVDAAVQATQPLDAEGKIEPVEAIAAATGRPVDLIDLATVGEPLLEQILGMASV